MKSELELAVRYYETDQMGVVHHSNYLRYFETGRSDMMVKYGLPVERIEAEGVMMPVVSSECRYLLPAKMGDVLTVVTFIRKVPLAKLTVECEIYNQREEKLFSGNVVLGFIDVNTRRPVRCPKSLVEIIEQNIND